MSMKRSQPSVRASRRPNEVDPTSHGAPAVLANESAALEAVIEDERSSLMTVEALLDCIVLAMDAHEGASIHGPAYPALVMLARDLLRQSIDRLDSMRLQSMLLEVRARECFEVKDGVVAYVH